MASITTHFFVTSAGLAENVLMCEIREKQIGAECAELGGFLEKPRPRVNGDMTQLHQQKQQLENMVQ
ncbi:hypothetical protein [Bradyrhizobium sp. 2S1]|uniref:hypothetical protein n=1 Tax=Bradyrhizobium sp. 2S1 TaxID=1404429 RepID=UPI00140ADFFA|nr:hypothetical protein [Bradyrhizobium sp. 2S1]MCK7670617.1 hypothetical protein [Bradyrhizobium sp. 2S1]